MLPLLGLSRYGIIPPATVEVSAGLLNIEWYQPRSEITCAPTPCDSYEPIRLEITATSLKDDPSIEVPPFKCRDFFWEFPWSISVLQYTKRPGGWSLVRHWALKLDLGSVTAWCENDHLPLPLGCAKTTESEAMTLSDAQENIRAVFVRSRSFEDPLPETSMADRLLYLQTWWFMSFTRQGRTIPVDPRIDANDCVLKESGVLTLDRFCTDLCNRKFFYLTGWPGYVPPPPPPVPPGVLPPENIPKRMWWSRVFFHEANDEVSYPEVHWPNGDGGWETTGKIRERIEVNGITSYDYTRTKVHECSGTNVTVNQVEWGRGQYVKSRVEIQELSGNWIAVGWTIKSYDKQNGNTAYQCPDHPCFPTPCIGFKHPGWTSKKYWVKSREKWVLKYGDTLSDAIPIGNFSAGPPAGPGESNPPPDEPPLCPQGQCYYTISAVATITVGFTVLGKIRYTRPSGTYYEIEHSIPIEFSLSYPLPPVSLCGPDMPNYITDGAARLGSQGLSLVVDRAVDAAIIAAFPAGGVAVSQVVDTDIALNVGKICY